MSTIRTFDVATKGERIEEATPGQLDQTITVTVADIVTERKRRLELGFDYDFGAPRGVHHIGCKPDDMEGWRDVKDYANALIDTGDPDTEINIVTDTGPVAVTAPEWQAVMLRAAEVRQVLWAASFALQDSLPEDFKNDTHWT
jgi:hypothetical protein